MPPTGSDRELRRLVADLAATTSEDMAAVLGMLDPRHAAQVRSMLAAYGGVADAFDVEAAPPRGGGGGGGGAARGGGGGPGVWWARPPPRRSIPKDCRIGWRRAWRTGSWPGLRLIE